MKGAMTVEDMKRDLRENYELPDEEAERYLSAGTTFRDLKKSCLYSCLTGRPLDAILALRREKSWWQVEMALHLTPAAYRAAWIRHCADRLHRWWGVDAARAEAMMTEGYPMHWVKIAWLLSERSPMSMEDILHRRTRAVKWRTFAKENLSIDEEAYNAMIAAHRNPALPPKE